MPYEEAEKRYHVPVILHNLPRAQAVQQALDSLEHLDKVIDDAFRRVSARVVVERQKVDGIVKRVEACRSKVQMLSRDGEKKATTVFSACKYPAPETLPTMPRLFNEEKNDQGKPKWTKLTLSKDDNHAPAERANTSDLFTELTKLLHTSVEDSNKIRRRQTSNEGLGKLPGYLPSVSSTLLFNSSENPYRDYSSFDNLVSALTKEKDVVQDEELAAAPLTLVEGAELPSFDNPMEALKYNPQIEELPTLDLPENLPLGQLADISFLTQVEGSIAPSLGNLNDLSVDLKDLPPITGPSKKQPTMEGVPNLPDLHTSATASSAATASIPISAPSAVDSIPSTANIPSKPIQPPSMSGKLIPPLTMDAPPTNLPPPPQVESVPPAPSLPSAPDGGGRTALLSAIRAGKKLKKSKRQRKGKKKETPPPMDMMGQLRARLARHRKAIGGKAEIKRSSLAIVEIKKPNRPPPRRSAILQGPPSKRLPSLKSDEKHDEGLEPKFTSLEEANENLSSQIAHSFPRHEDDGNAADDDDDGWEST